MKFLIDAQQLIKYEFEIEANSLDEVREWLKNNTIDHDTCFYGADSLVINLPTITYWEQPDYSNIAEVK